MAQQIISSGVQNRCAQVVCRIEQQQIIALLAQADREMGFADDPITAQWFVINNGVFASGEPEVISSGSTAEDVVAFAPMDDVLAGTTAQDVVAMAAAELIISPLGNQTVSTTPTGE